MEIFWSDNVEGNIIRLNEEESAHCVKVLRHRVGDGVCIIDGEGSMYECRLVDANPKQAVAQVEKKVPGYGSHPYHLTLAVCPTKNNDRFEWFAEKATEVGVDVIAPVIGERSERKVYKIERLQRIALSATKQSLKGRIPESREPISVKEFIKAYADTAPSECLKLIAYCFEGEKLSIKQALDSFKGTAADGLPHIVVMIGPEGDFSPSEVSEAIRAGFKPVHLGNSRLRTETAAVTAAEAVYFKYM